MKILSAKMSKQKLTYYSLLSLAALQNLFAQAAPDKTVDALNEATTKLNKYFDPATKVMYAISAIIGLIGGIKVYSKWNSGDPDTQKVAASWFGACIFLVVVATVIKTFFSVE